MCLEPTPAPWCKPFAEQYAGEPCIFNCWPTKEGRIIGYDDYYVWVECTEEVGNPSTIDHYFKPRTFHYGHWYGATMLVPRASVKGTLYNCSRYSVSPIRERIQVHNGVYASNPKDEAYLYRDDAPGPGEYGYGDI